MWAETERPTVTFRDFPPTSPGTIVTRDQMQLNDRPSIGIGTQPCLIEFHISLSVGGSFTHFSSLLIEFPAIQSRAEYYIDSHALYKLIN